jgi:hypothetical protein
VEKTEKIVEESGTFSPRKNDHQRTTFCRAFHHDLTTKNHLLHAPFYKTPLKNTSKKNKTPARARVSFFSKKTPIKTLFSPW